MIYCLICSLVNSFVLLHKPELKRGGGLPDALLLQGPLIMLKTRNHMNSD
jgi:hypothetical protein